MEALDAVAFYEQPLSEGCLFKRDASRDQVLTYNDAELPHGRLCDRLRAEQAERFGQRASSRALS